MKQLRIIYFYDFLLLFFIFANFSQAKESSFSLSTGINHHQGNTESTLIDVALNSNIEWEKSRFTGDIDAKFLTEDNDEETINRYTIKSQYDHDVTTITHIYFHASGLFDKIADIDYQVLVGPGVGLKIKNSDSLKWKIESGLSYQLEKIKDESKSNEIAWRINTELDYQSIEKWDSWFNLEYTSIIKDFSDYFIKSEIGIESKLTKTLALRFTVQSHYNSRPSLDKEKHDLSFRSMITYKIN